MNVLLPMEDALDRKRKASGNVLLPVDDVLHRKRKASDINN